MDQFLQNRDFTEKIASWFLVYFLVYVVSNIHTKQDLSFPSMILLPISWRNSKNDEEMHVHGALVYYIYIWRFLSISRHILNKIWNLKVVNRMILRHKWLYYKYVNIAHFPIVAIQRRLKTNKTQLKNGKLQNPFIRIAKPTGPQKHA